MDQGLCWDTLLASLCSFVYMSSYGDVTNIFIILIRSREVSLLVPTVLLFKGENGNQSEYSVIKMLVANQLIG